MNPVIDRQWARLRTRLAKTPLPGFFKWWGSQLVACLPARWRALVEERSESLLLDLRDNEIIVWRERADDETEYGRIPRNLPPEAQTAEFKRLREAIDDPGVRTVLCIPADRVLQRDLSLPTAAEDNLRQVLSFEMDRQTPFKADQIYFDSRVLGHDASGRNLKVELVLLPRARLDQELGMLPPGAAALDAVDAWLTTPGAGRRHINLLPAERRARRRDLRLPLNLGLAALALILLFVNMDEALTNREAAVEAMRAEVEKSNTEARQVAALRKTLTDSISGANFLSDKKRNGPLQVALLDDLSRRLPEDTYLERLQIENGEAQLQGQAKEAAKLIALLGASTCLSTPMLQGQIQPDPRTSKERFQITAKVKGCNTAPTVAPAIAADSEAAPIKGAPVKGAAATHVPGARAGDPVKKAAAAKSEKPVAKSEPGDKTPSAPKLGDKPAPATPKPGDKPAPAAPKPGDKPVPPAPKPATSVSTKDIKPPAPPPKDKEPSHGGQ